MQPLDEDVVLKFLRCPSTAVVELALSMANLTWREELAINLCGRKGKTQEKAAEEAGYSPDAMQKWYRSGIKKLCINWAGVWWVQSLTDY